MFNGIIFYLGTIVELRSINEWDLEFTVKITYQDPSFFITLPEGASVAFDGTCLTVTSIKHGDHSCYLSVHVSSTSIKTTNISNWRIGSILNIEFAIKVGDMVHGHFVSGHIDTTTKVLKIERIGDSHQLTLNLPEEWKPYVASKGSITINGVALTVVETQHDSFMVNIIPYTYSHTNLHTLNIGSVVNLEFDAVARYIVRLNELKADPDSVMV